MKFSKVLVAGLMMAGLASQAQAIKMNNITINGMPYASGMKIDEDVTSLKIGGDIVLEAVDHMFANGRNAAAYPGVGFFAIGTTPCVVDAPGWDAILPDPARCIPNFTIDTKNTNWMGVGTTGVHVVPAFDNAKTTFDGTFEKTIPVSSSTTSGTFSVTYQLNSSDNAKGYSMGMLWLLISPQSAAAGGSNNFMPRITLNFNDPSFTPSHPMAFASVDNNTPLTAKTLTATVTPSSADQGKAGALYLAALTPNGTLYVNDGNVWKVYDGKGIPAYQSVTLGVSHTIPVQTKPADFSSIKGTKVILGYGVGTTATAVQDDLLKNSKHNLSVPFVLQ